MGRKSGITSGGYHPQIHKMHWVMAQREWNREQEQKVINEKRMKAAYWMQRLNIAVNALKNADPNGWESWYDDDANLPADAKNQDLTTLVEARVIALTGAFPFYREIVCRDIYIWNDRLGFFVFSKEEGEDALYLFSFDTFEQAESFIKGLPYKNCGYGVVLDLLPANALAPLPSASPQIKERDLEGVKGK